MSQGQSAAMASSRAVPERAFGERRWAWLLLTSALLLALALAPLRAFAAEEAAPSDVVLDGHGFLYVTDYLNDRVLVLSTFDGTVVDQWGHHGNEPGAFDGPFGIAIDPTGNAVYVVDQLNNRVQKFTLDGQLITSWGEAGAAPGQLRTPFGVVSTLQGVYVADFGNDRVQLFTADGQLVQTWGIRGTALGQFTRPLGVAVDRAGFIYVSDHFNNRVQKFSPLGFPVAIIGAPAADIAAQTLRFTDAPFLPEAQLFRPEGLALDREGNLYVADYGRNRVAKFGPDGQLLGAWGTLGDGPGEFREPKGIAVDQVTGRVYVADTGNGRIQRFTSDGVLEAVWYLP